MASRCSARRRVNPSHVVDIIGDIAKPGDSSENMATDLGRVDVTQKLESHKYCGAAGIGTSFKQTIVMSQVMRQHNRLIRNIIFG